MQIHQGTTDAEVPLVWSDWLAQTLEATNSAVSYFTYPGADHNMQPDAWNTVVARDITFFGKYLR